MDFFEIMDLGVAVGTELLIPKNNTASLAAEQVATCAKKQVLRKKIQRATYATD